MKLNSESIGKRVIRSLQIIAVLTLTIIASRANAQTETADAKAAEAKAGAETYQTIYLTNLTQPSDANDLQTDLRNMLPKARLYYVPSQSALSVRGSAEDIALAQKILADLDRVKKIYRLTYTITDIDGGKTTGTQHVSLIVASGGKTTLRQGNRVPLVTGTSDGAKVAESSQVQYVDVGLNIEASLEGSLDSVRLRTKVEQSAVADEKSSVGLQDPVIRQTTLEGTSTLAQGKPLVLGSLDVPGSTRHEEIAVVSELVR
jgi:Bacterial type II and III secretion system protein